MAKHQVIKSSLTKYRYGHEKTRSHEGKGSPEELRFPPSNHLEVLKGKRKIDPDMAVRIGKLFGMNAETWLKLQAEFDLESMKSAHRKKIEKNVTSAVDAAA